MKIITSCNDEFEAQKLSGLIFLSEQKETHITEILNIVENEMIILVKDGSAHSILLKDESHVEKFADFIQSVFEKKHRIVEVITQKETVQITKE